uniref:Uncharacterized protein n=1 Tax=Oryza brachyantha TaxID=4533 RepID=J3N7T6_ORYBR
MLKFSPQTYPLLISACNRQRLPKVWVGFTYTFVLTHLLLLFLDINAGNEMPSDEYFAPGTTGFEDGSF